MAPWRSLLLAVSMALLGLMVHEDASRHGPGWRVAAELQPLALVNLTQLREEALDMFRLGYSEYMRLAFPRDDLRPISCRGKDSQGGIALTMIDSLDTLIVMGDRERLQQAVRWLAANASFDIDARVHVFELTIRAVGGMLSAHMLIQQDPSLVPNYDGSLLRLAVDLTDRFMPAFDTPTGVPLSWVNLRRGQIPGDVRSTCTACAGTLLLEFGVLTRLTGNATYEAKARHAVETIFKMRSARGLVGNTLDCDDGRWVRTDAGVGAGVDSFYEYLLKAYLAFGDPSYLHMFKEVYAAAMTNLQLDPAWNGHVWLVDVDMQSGQVLHPYVWSLGAFWPGLQALAGQVDEAAALHANWTSAWNKFGWLPEMFDVGLDARHPTETGYPLRPELMESTYLLHAATGDPRLLGVGAALQQRLRDKNRVACGYASVGDVSTGQLEDTMESFFLSETVKYLYLLFSNASALVDHFVLSTEGHLLPPFPDAPAPGEVESNGTAALPPQQLDVDGGCSRHHAQSDKCSGEQAAGMCAASEQQQQREGACRWSDLPSAQQQRGENAGDARHQAGARNRSGSSKYASADSRGEAVEEEQWQQQVEELVEEKCRPLCSADPAAVAGQQAASAALAASLPLLPLPLHGHGLLRARRCAACREVTWAVRRAERLKAQRAQQAQRSKEAVAVAKVALGSAPAVAASGLAVNRQFLCVVEDMRRGSLGCGVFKEIPTLQIAPRSLNALPHNYMLVQLTDVPPQAAAASAAAASAAAQQQQASCVAPGGDADPLGPYQVSLELVLPDGTASRHTAMLADFGPVFEPGCSETEGIAPGGSLAADSGGAAGASSSASSSSSSSGSAGSSEGGSGEPAASAAAPQQPPQLHGRRLAARVGTAPGREHRLVYVLDSGREESEEEADDDPYEDPFSEELPSQQPASLSDAEEGPDSGGSSSSSSGEDASAAGGEQQQQRQGSDGAEGDGGDGGHYGTVLCSAEGVAVAAQPLDACSPLQNAEELQGRVAVVQRGRCMFVQKVLAAQRAGSVAVVVLNTEDHLMSMGTDLQGSQSDVPAVILPSSAGQQLLTALRVQAGVRVRLSAPPLPEHDAAHGASSHVEPRCSAAAGASALERTAAGAQQAQQAQQQVELLLSPQAQAWLLDKLATTMGDPAAALSRILAQIQAHFAGQKAAGKAAGGGGEALEEEDEEDEEE